MYLHPGDVAIVLDGTEQHISVFDWRATPPAGRDFRVNVRLYGDDTHHVNLYGPSREAIAVQLEALAAQVRDATNEAAA